MSSVAAGRDFSFFFSSQLNNFFARLSSSVVFIYFCFHFSMATPLPTPPEGEEAARNPYTAPEIKRKSDVRARDFEKPAGLARLESILARIYVEDSFASTAYADRLDAKAVVESIL